MGQSCSRTFICTLVLRTIAFTPVVQGDGNALFDGVEQQHGPRHPGNANGQFSNHQRSRMVNKWSSPDGTSSRRGLGGIPGTGYEHGPPDHGGRPSSGHGRRPPWHGGRPGHGGRPPPGPPFAWPWPRPPHRIKPAKQLQSWYEHTVNDCGTSDEPSFLCSGVMLRGTVSNLAYLPWDPSPRQVTLGSTSFSWLRKDQTFARVLYNNGYIFYPRDDVPKAKDKIINVFCSFPVDGYSHTRADHGCGIQTGWPNETDTCQNLGITTPEQWIAKYGNVIYHICGWLLTKGVPQPALAFKTCVNTHQALPDAQQEWQIYNELVLEVWPAGLGASLPIHSFFYLEDKLLGLVSAQSDQGRYYQEYQQVVPIVRMTLPQKKGDDARFAYSADDQLAGKSNQNYSITFDDVPVGRYEAFASNGVNFELAGNGQVQDGPIDSGNRSQTQLADEYFSGHYVTSNTSVFFSIPGFGTRRVTLSWGCRSVCIFSEKIAANDTIIYVDETNTSVLGFGRSTYLVTAPELIEIATGGSDEIEVAVDNIVII